MDLPPVPCEDLKSDMAKEERTEEQSRGQAGLSRDQSRGELEEDEYRYLHLQM